MHDNTFTMIENIAHLMVFENYKKSLIVASEASNVFIFSGQKFSKNGKNGSFWQILSLRLNSVTRQVNLNRTKIGGKRQNWKIQIDFGWDGARR